MGESAQHQQLVKLIIDYIVNLVENDKFSFITADITSGYKMPPQTIEGFRPDAFYFYEKQMIIGEAKTSQDIARYHSLQQYESYIKKCMLFEGNATLVVAVPWIDHASIYNILKRIQKQYPGNYSIKILDGFGGAL